MNGGHDLGGRHGLGPIDPESESKEPVFHAGWERRVFGLNLAAGAVGRWNLDVGRFARERQHPADYLRHSYYENWLAGLETLLVESGLVTRDEIESGKARGVADEALKKRVLRPARVAPALAKGSPVDMTIDTEPRFKPGDAVRAINRHPLGHTREPGYVRGRSGVVAAHYGAHVYPDLHAQGVKEGRHLYSVRFEAAALWGESAEGASAVYVDLWEDYLEAA